MRSSSPITGIPHWDAMNEGLPGGTLGVSTMPAPAGSTAVLAALREAYGDDFTLPDTTRAHSKEPSRSARGRGRRTHDRYSVAARGPKRGLRRTSRGGSLNRRVRHRRDSPAHLSSGRLSA